MRALVTMAAALGVASIIAVGSSDSVPAADQKSDSIPAADQSHQDRYYYNGGRWCPPNWTVEGGMCKPHRRSPWDWYREQV
jgi:hypothetical protein